MKRFWFYLEIQSMDTHIDEQPSRKNGGMRRSVDTLQAQNVMQFADKLSEFLLKLFFTTTSREF